MKPADLNARLKCIRLVALDVDGVLTDGTLGVTGGGGEIKFFHTHDGAGVKYLQRAGIRVAILSGRRAQAVDHRAKELGIRLVLQGVKFKLVGLKRLARLAKIPAGSMCYVGDDLPDIPVMRQVGLAVAVADARPEVRRAAHWVTRARGGRGAVREVAERILKAQRKWANIVVRYGLTAGGGRAGGAS